MTRINIEVEKILPQIKIKHWRSCLPDFFVCLLLLLAVFSAFGPALKIGFLSDDYDHIGHVYQLLQPGSKGFSEPFLGTWRHNTPEVELYYRPLALLSYLPELCLWGANPYPYHLTNLLLHWLCSCLAYFLAKRIASLFGFKISRISAFFAGMLFAVHPLHAETAIWIIDRLDSLNTVFVLSSLLLYERFMHSRKSAFLGLSVLSFTLALLTKEASATTPFLLLVLQLASASNPLGIKENLKHCRFILIHLCILVVFVLVRWHFLGCLIGGYSPVQQLSHMQLLTQAFFWKNTILHGAYPICDGQDTMLLAGLFACAYLLWGASVLMRIKCRAIEANWISMQITTLLLAVISSLPVLPILHISAGLMGGRTIYLPSVFFLIFLSNFHLLGPLNQPKNKLAKNLALAALSFYLAACLSASWHNNQFWLETSERTRQFARGWEKLLLSLPPGQKLLLVNPPVLHKEIHMIYMSPTLKYLAQPPFSPHNLSDRIISFEPYHGLPHIFFDIDAIRELAGAPTPPNFSLWNPDSGSFSLVLPQVFEQKFIQSYCLQQPLFAGKRQSKDLTIYDFHCPINPLAVDILEVTVSATQAPAVPPPAAQTSATQAPATRTSATQKNNSSSSRTALIALELGEQLFQQDGSLKWGNRWPVQIKVDGKSHVLRFTISEWRELAHKTLLPGFSLYVFANGNIVRLEKVNFRQVKELRPALSLKNPARTTENGKWIIDRLQMPSLTFAYDASGLPQASQVQIEICPVDTWFPAYNFCYFDEQKCILGDRTSCGTTLKGSITFPVAKFKFKGEYQIRAIALDKKSKVVGYCSKPIKLVFKSGFPAPRY